MDSKEIRPEWVPSAYMNLEKQQPVNTINPDSDKAGPGTSKTFFTPYSERRRQRFLPLKSKAYRK